MYNFGRQVVKQGQLTGLQKTEMNT